MRPTISLAVLLLAGTATSAFADTITIAQAHAVVDEELKLVAKTYVFPEKREAIVAAIRAKEAAGAYDLTNPTELAEKLGGDVIAVAHDKHMWMQYDPQQYAAAQAPQDDPKAAAFFERQAQRSNYGYENLRILPGNVRYVNLTTFNWDSKTVPQAVTDAARFLGGGDAVIIDLRQNGGGSGTAVRDLISYFMPAKPQLLMSYHDGVTGKTDTSMVDTKLAAPRMAGKPLYVLISGNTGSAAEEFTDHVKLFKLGTLVGETTAGAANDNSITPIAPGFMSSISTGRAIHPVDNGNWEGTGIAPDVAVEAGRALDQAHLLALQALSAKPGADPKDYAWAIAGETARSAPPPKLDAAALAAYAGTYGIRKVWVEDGALVFQRDGRPKRTMTAMSADHFTLGDDDTSRVLFHRTNGKITGFDIETADGQTVPVTRTN